VLALASEPDLHVLLAGLGSDRITVGGRPGIGFVDVGPFLSACDVLAAPTLFDPAPVAVLEGLSRSVPVVTTAVSGWARAIGRHACGVVWDRATGTLAHACRVAATASCESCRGFIDALAPDLEREVLIGAYEYIMASKGLCSRRDVRDVRVDRAWGHTGS
jgi:glycosyltransferase involved in cell wall biosynthesis